MHGFRTHEFKEHRIPDIGPIDGLGKDVHTKAKTKEEILC